MKTIDYSIEGDVKTASRTDLSQIDLEIHGFVDNREVGHSPIAKSGHYKMTFQFGEQPPAVQLRVLPAELATDVENALTLNTRVNPLRYRGNDASRTAYQDVLVPPDFLEIARTAIKLYKMHGAVFATKFLGGDPIAIEPVAGVKIEFFLLNPPTKPALPIPARTKPLSLGHAFTGPDGEYQFQFKLTAKNPLKPLPWTPLPPVSRLKPTLQARIFQLFEGAWKHIYTAPVDWDGSDDFQRDYFVPEGDVMPTPPPSGIPATGFRFSSIGLLPLDTTRLVSGYYTAKPGDPIDISNAPFCDTLNIFGLFAADPVVAYYKVEVAETDQYGVPGTWTDVADPLTNYKWNDTTHAWDYRPLGPDQLTKLYTNIDTEPEANWLFHELKVTWNSRNRTDGYYALRITGYDATLNPIGTPCTTPAMRIDNTPPEVALDVISPGVGKCGGLALGADRKITFAVTAYDPAGHVARYWLSGSRGKTAGTAGPLVEVDRPTPLWIGPDHGPQVFAVDVRPPELADCTQIAYNFELHVRGLATNGYTKEPISQWAEAQMDLIVSE